MRFEDTVYGRYNNKRNNRKVRKSSRRSAYECEDEYSDSDDNCRHRAGSFELMNDEVMAPSSSFAPGSTTSPGRIRAQGSGDAGSTLFLIPREVTIASDSKAHKVTVMIASLSPQMVHYVAPAVSSHAYIQAKTQNTSQYPLLASKSVSVFLDGCFVASSSSIEQTSSGEYFSVYLGVDPAIKVTHTPCRTTQQTKGWLNGTEVKKAHYSTVLHNTKQRPCRVIVAEVLPRSSTEKIVVELIEPAGESPVLYSLPFVFYCYMNTYSYAPCIAFTTRQVNQIMMSADTISIVLPLSILARSSFSTASSLTKSSEDAVVTSERDVLAALDSFGRGDDSSSAPQTAEHTAWPKDFVTQNKYTNNIVWLKTVPAGDKVELKFSYKISWPQGQNISIDTT